MLCLDADNPTMLAKSSTHFLDGSSGNLIPSDGDRLVQKDIQRAVEEHKCCFSFNKICFTYQDYITFTKLYRT
jgi:hypothetical protein